jgi:tol-pal system protein YbgF
MRPTLPLLLLAGVAAGCATTPPDQDPVQIKLNDLDGRLARTERIAANDVQVAQRLDEIQASLRELRGRVEELEHNYDALSKQQRDLYNDLDKRLAAAAAGAGGSANSPAAGGAAAAGNAAAGAGNAAPGGAGGGGASSTEQAVYGQAFDALKAGSYSIAIAGFKDFLNTYPSSSLAENAQYWLGEAYYVTHDYEAASGAFRTVLRKWPDSRKAPDALLKLGYTQAAQKQYPAARATLTEVTRKYPDSQSAKLAADRLKRLPAQPSQ